MRNPLASAVKAVRISWIGVLIVTLFGYFAILLVGLMVLPKVDRGLPGEQTQGKAAGIAQPPTAPGSRAPTVVPEPVTTSWVTIGRGWIVFGSPPPRQPSGAQRRRCQGSPLARSLPFCEA
jgi:hypothetical protein